MFYGSVEISDIAGEFRYVSIATIFQWKAIAKGLHPVILIDGQAGKRSSNKGTDVSLSFCAHRRTEHISTRITWRKEPRVLAEDCATKFLSLMVFF